MMTFFGTRKNRQRSLVVITALFLATSCKQEPKIIIDSAEVLHQNQEALTQVIIDDVFTPPVASRIYAYTSLASYEAIRFNKPGNESMTDKMREFEKMPAPENGKEYNFTLAASQAFFTVAHKVVFSVDSLKKYEDKLLESFKRSIDNDSIYSRSIDFGNQIGKTVLARAMKDNYIQSRGKPKFLGSNKPGKWKPTPPDYLDGIEWCWNEMHPFLLDSAAQFYPEPPPVYSTDTISPFFKMVKLVYDKGETLTEEEKTIARFWDDNPFVMQHSGHMMFANKKLTPGGHWMGIAGIAARQSKADDIKTAKTFAMTAVALYDAFISCWDTKYKYSYIRPVTVINDYIDKTWTPFLQTPAFPEYTSGHSTITGSAATVLTALYGNNFAFLDNSDKKYIGMERHFDSFLQAAQECSDSRFYGGIHYKLTVDRSAAIGRSIGQFIVTKQGLGAAK